MKNLWRLVLILVLLAITVSGLVMIIFSFRVIKVEEIYTDLVVTTNEKVGGFAIDRENIRFGKLNPDSESIRKMHFESQKRVLVNLKLIGNISQHVIASDNNFIVNPGEYKTVVLTARPEAGTLPGNYTGHVRVTFLHPWFR